MNWPSRSRRSWRSLMTETWRTGSRSTRLHHRVMLWFERGETHTCLKFQARNRSGQVGYVPEKYLQLPSSNSLLSMLQALAALDARSHSSSSNSTELETELPSGSVNGDSNGEETRVSTTEVAAPRPAGSSFLTVHVCRSVFCEGALRLLWTNGGRAVVSRRSHHSNSE